jgi:hypothetical protein
VELQVEFPISACLDLHLSFLVLESCTFFLSNTHKDVYHIFIGEVGKEDHPHSTVTRMALSPDYADYSRYAHLNNLCKKGDMSPLNNPADCHTHPSSYTFLNNTLTEGDALSKTTAFLFFRKGG